MSQYEELKRLIEDLNNKVEKIANPMIYNYIDDNMPSWAVPTITKLVSRGVLAGDENGLGLTYDMLRILVICDRSGAFGD